MFFHGEYIEIQTCSTMSFNEIPELSTLLVGRKSSCVSGSLGTELKYRFPAWYKDLEPCYIYIYNYKAAVNEQGH